MCECIWFVKIKKLQIRLLLGKCHKKIFQFSPNKKTPKNLKKKIKFCITKKKNIENINFQFKKYYYIKFKKCWDIWWWRRRYKIGWGLTRVIWLKWISWVWYLFRIFPDLPYGCIQNNHQRFTWNYKSYRCVWIACFHLLLFITPQG